MKGQRLTRQRLALLVLVAALAGNYFLGPLPFSLPGAAYHGSSYARTSHDAVLDRALALIPPRAVVSVNNNAGAQLSARRVVYVFPYFERAQYVIVDERHPFVFDVEDSRLHALAVAKLREDARFRSIFREDGVEVFTRAVR